MRLIQAGLLLLCVGLAAASCSASAVVDHIPVWAGGEPEGVPPRPGSPGYEAYRQKLGHPSADGADKSADGADTTQASGQQTPASGTEAKN